MSPSELPMVWGRYPRYEGTKKVLSMAGNMHFWPRGKHSTLCRAKGCVKGTTCLREILKPTTSLHNHGLSSLKLFTVAHTIQVGRARLRWSIHCDALRCAYLHTRLPSATSRTARDTGRVIVLCTALAVGANGAGGTHWTCAKGVDAMAPPERCVVACLPVHQLHSCRRKSCAEGCAGQARTASRPAVAPR